MLKISNFSKLRVVHIYGLCCLFILCTKFHYGFNHWESVITFSTTVASFAAVRTAAKIIYS
jgi:hypothetical protein